MKSVFLDGRVLVNATLFDTELSNFQDRSFSGTSLPGAGTPADVRSRGVDFDGQVKLPGGFSVSSAVTYLDAAYTTRSFERPTSKAAVAANGQLPGERGRTSSFRT